MNTARKFLIVVLAFSVVSLSCSLSSQVQGEPTPTRLAAPARQEGTTNSSGAVTFEDPSTGEDVVVTVLDGGQELQGAEVAYFHGQTNLYEVYLVRDVRGLLAMEFYLHNSEHTLEVTRGEIRPLNPEQVEALEGYVSDMGLVSRNTYLETIPNAELQQRMTELQVAGDVMLFFIGTFWEIGRAAKAFLGAIGDAIGILPQPEDPNIRWDLYQSYDAEWGYTALTFVQSQPPLPQSPTVDVGEDGSVTISLLGIDPVRYPTTSTQFAGMPDQTIFEGPTEFSDLVYFYGVETEDGTTMVANEVRQNSVCVQGNCTRTELNLGILPASSYYLRYQVLDEVGNFSLPMEMGFEVGTVQTQGPIYSDPNSFLAELKRALETADFEVVDQLLVPPSMGDFAFGFFAYFYEEQPASHQEAMDWYRERAPFTEVDITGRAEQFFSLLADPKPETDLLALVYWEGRQEPSFLLIHWIDNRYWWDGFLAVSCTSTLGGQPQEEARRRFCQEIGTGQTGQEGPIAGYTDLSEFTQALQDSTLGGMEELLHEPIYLHEIGCIGECTQSAVSSLSGYSSPAEGREYIMACWEHLSGLMSTGMGITRLVFSPEPREDAIPIRPAIEDTLFYVGWQTYYSSGEKAYPELFLGLGQQEGVYQVTEAFCYPWVQ